MMNLLSLLNNKYALWMIIVTAISIAFGVNAHNSSKHDTAMDTYKRQLSGQLFDSEQELQEAKHNIGVFESKLLSQEELANKLKTDKEELDKEFDKFKKRHNLIVRSRDRAIAKLKQRILGGESSVIVGDRCDILPGECVISYQWSGALGRFKLTDPNIWESGDEIFESEQIFKIYGEILAQKDGSLLTRRLVLREVIQNSDGSYSPIPDAKAEIVDSDFQYSNKPVINNPGHFRLRLITVYGLSTYPFNSDKISSFGLGAEFINFGRVGANIHLSLDPEDWNNTDLRLGSTYRPFKDFNVAAGASIGTPVVSLFSSYSLNIDLIFFINN